VSETLIINSEVALAQAQRELAKAWKESRYIEVDFRRKAKQRTLTQNRALHLFCEWLAETLNDAGYDMRRTLKQDVELPWSQTSVKDFLWRPIQKAMTDKTSTVEITTTEPTDIHAVLSRHLGQKLGIECPPWPKREQEAKTA